VSAVALQFVIAELNRRAARKGYSQALQPIFDPKFPKQDSFIRDTSQFVGSLCSRRAGKSTAWAYKYHNKSVRFPGVMMPYIALTRDSAKNIMWPILQEFDERHKVGIKFLEASLTARFPWGSSIKLFGADQKNFIKRIRGIKTPLAGVDEAQEFGSHIESLVDDVLTASIADFGVEGQIGLSGTPGPVPHGYFYEVTGRLLHGYSLHKWTLYDNPYMPDPRGFVEKLKAKKAWPDNHPTLLREYFGLWVLDRDVLVFKYDPEKNHYDELPKLPEPIRHLPWEYVIGVDLGSNRGKRDKDAIGVIAFHPHYRGAYLVEEILGTQEGITPLISNISRMVERYNPMKIVMDTAGLGTKLVDELQQRHGMPIVAAEKQRKFEFIELLNDAMRTGAFFAKKTSVFADDSYRVQWDLEAKTLKVAESFHSDIADAVLYGFRESLHWLSEPHTELPEVGSNAYFEQQAREMEEAARRAAQPPEEDIWGDQGMEDFG
jgi:hypothetical protein